MRIVVVGSGAREHALQWKLAADGYDVVVTPGRTGIPGSVSTSPEELDADLFVIGPEDPLVNGLADVLRGRGKLVYGPGALDARLEGSKVWMKDLLTQAGVKTAEYFVVFPAGDVSGAQAEAEDFIRSLHWSGYVIKTDYLNAGKGVLVTRNVEEAVADAQSKLKKGSIVIEEALEGEEMSFFAVCSGDSWSLLPSARDYKRLLDGDLGPNTGGMGSFTPVSGGPSLGELAAIIDPVLKQLDDFRGTLFGGVMLTDNGIYVLEFNIRFGDPEIQSIVGTLDVDLGQVLQHAARGEELPRKQLASSGASVTVVLASEGYPVAPVTGDVITGIEDAEQIPCVTVFHAGTAKNSDGQFVTAGGRVLSVTATAPSVGEAKRRAYEAVKRINWRGMQYRTDIAAGE